MPFPYPSPLTDHSHGGYLLLNLQMSSAGSWKLLETFKLLNIGRTLGIKSLCSKKMACVFIEILNFNWYF